MVDNFFEKTLEFILPYIKPEGLMALTICFCIIYIWYLRNSKQLQKEHIKILIEQYKLKADREEKIEQYFKKRPKRNISKNKNAQTKILIVDDDNDIRDVIEAIALDYDNTMGIELSANGYDALKKILNEPPDLLICDTRMPQMSGIELLEKLQENKINIPTIIMDIYADELIPKIQNLNIKNIDMIEKPFNPENLKFLIKKHLTK